MKVRVIACEADVDTLIALVTGSAQVALEEIGKAAEHGHGLHALWAMKFTPLGRNPLDTAMPLNLIEQLNQTFTYLASARALKLLLRIEAGYAPFTVNLGTAPGSDIESDVGDGLAAETFAAVNTSNNRKLVSDIRKVSKTAAKRKYVFFMCPGYEEGRQMALERDGVQVWSVGTGL